MTVILFHWTFLVFSLIGCSRGTSDSQTHRDNTIQQQQQRQVPRNNNNNNLILGPENVAASNNKKTVDWSRNISSDELPELSTDWLMLGGSQSATDGAARTHEEMLVPNETKSSVSFATSNENTNDNIMSLPKSSLKSTRKNHSSKNKKNKGLGKGNRTATASIYDDKQLQQQFDDEQQSDESNESNEIFDDIEEIKLAGTQKEPECAGHGRYYCTYKEDYPIKLVTEVTKYYKWPLEKLFRDLHAQIMPKLAHDSNGNLVCDSITRVVRPGWARNTNDRWLVVINTDNYHQYVTEVVCQYGSNSRCNFIPPCYYSSCQQRYNTQKLLVIDPTNPYRGPFLSEFLFPSCCVCYVPKTSEGLTDKYRTSPATIYQRTMQQESSTNLNPMQGYNNLIEISPMAPPESETQASNFLDQSNGSQAKQQAAQQQQSASASNPNSNKMAPPPPMASANQLLGPGEIRRNGDLFPA